MTNNTDMSSPNIELDYRILMLQDETDPTNAILDQNMLKFNKILEKITNQSLQAQT